jgi:tetratricopeptide (TPR) repeat protein
MLAVREREVMRALSVFRGAFARKAAQQVSGASLTELRALVNKSLVHSAPEGYFEVHELLRQYAAEKLGETPSYREAVHDRHCAYYAAAAQRWGSELKGPQQIMTLAEMRADRENVRVAWEWAVAHRHVARLGQALDGLCWHFLWRGRFRAGRAACRAAADVLGSKPQGDRLLLMTRILAWESDFCTKLGQLHTASETLECCLSLLDTLGPDSLRVKAGVLRQMGSLAYVSGDNVKARRLFEQSLDLCQTLGDRWCEAEALTNIGRVAWSSGAYDEAQRWAEKSLEIRQSRGDKRGIAHSLDLLGFIAAYQGQMDESVKLRRELLAIYNQIGDRPGAADGLFDLATGLIWSGEFAEAKSLLEESREIYDDLGSRFGVAFDDLFLGWIDGVLGRYAQARVRIENSLLDFRETGLGRGIGLALLFLGILTLADEDYATAEALLKEAAEFYEEIGQRDEWSIAVAGLGYVARALGDTAQARSYLWEALKTGVELHSFGLVIMSIPTVALLLADAGDSGAERAVENYALASRYRYISKSRFYEDIVGRHIAAVATTLPPDVVAAAQERGRARDLWETAKELLDELNA